MAHRTPIANWVTRTLEWDRNGALAPVRSGACFTLVAERYRSALRDPPRPWPHTLGCVVVRRFIAAGRSPLRNNTSLSKTLPLVQQRPTVTRKSQEPWLRPWRNLFGRKAQLTL